MASQDVTNSALLESFQAALMMALTFIIHITRCGIYPSFLEITYLKKEIVPAKLSYGLDLPLIQENNFMAACLHPHSLHRSLQVLKHPSSKEMKFSSYSQLKTSYLSATSLHQVSVQTQCMRAL